MRSGINFRVITSFCGSIPEQPWKLVFSISFTSLSWMSLWACCECSKSSRSWNQSSENWQLVQRSYHGPPSVKWIAFGGVDVVPAVAESSSGRCEWPTRKFHVCGMAPISSSSSHFSFCMNSAGWEFTNSGVRILFFACEQFQSIMEDQFKRG